MQIKMLASRFAAGGVLSYVAGSTYEVANDLALQFIGDNAAVEVNASRTAATGTQRDEFNRGAEGQAGVSLVSQAGISGATYDGSGRLTGYIRQGVVHTVSYPSSTTVVVSNTLGAEREVTLDGSGRVQAIA